ncbi:MAG: hypothetical protein KDE19_04250, partial [Caldilineaceae bacterium]|nr:hypothetical protein [Caldilineaceae bacterium]
WGRNADDALNRLDGQRLAVGGTGGIGRPWGRNADDTLNRLEDQLLAANGGGGIVGSPWG